MISIFGFVLLLASKNKLVEGVGGGGGGGGGANLGFIDVRISGVLNVGCKLWTCRFVKFCTCHAEFWGICNEILLLSFVLVSYVVS